MSTPIRRRFSVTTNILDKVAGRQTLDTAAFITTTALSGGKRYVEVGPFDWDTTFTTTTDPEYKWLQALFGQTLKPKKAIIIHWDKAGAVETIADALNDAKSLGANWYFLCYEGVGTGDITDQTAVANYVESDEERMMGILMTQDVNAYNSASTTDIGYICRSTNQNRTAVIFHPASVTLIDQTLDTSAERPDGAILGAVSTTDEGLVQWDYQALSFVSDSGLTAQQQSDLTTKGYNFAETFKRTTFTHLYRGRTCTDREIRIQWGADWFDISVESDIANYAFQNDLMAFDLETFTDIEGILNDWKKRALERRVIVDTKERPATIALPDPDTIDATTRASGVADFTNVYNFPLNSAVDNWTLTGNWRISL
jgi:hypothetical protein